MTVIASGETADIEGINTSNVLPNVNSSSSLTEDIGGSEKSGPEASDEAFSALEIKAISMVDDALLRLTKGLPRYELDLIVKEADECEHALLQEIAMLEKEATALTVAAVARQSQEQEQSAQGDKRQKNSNNTTLIKPSEKPDSTETRTNNGPLSNPAVAPFKYGLGYPFSSVDDVLSSDYSTVDRFITLSALLGRLFWPAPLPDQHPHAMALTEANKKVPRQQQLQNKLHRVQRQEKLLALQHSPYYTQSYASEEGNATLLAIWKKISSHKTALVFRRPVTDKDAPSYSDRILFPMDLSLVRKMITLQQIQSFADLHAKIALICHNCMKFNGAASDYGIVAKEFETFVDDAILNAVENAAAAAAFVPSADPTADANAVANVDGPSNVQRTLPKPSDSNTVEQQSHEKTLSATAITATNTASDINTEVANKSSCAGRESNPKLPNDIISTASARFKDQTMESTVKAQDSETANAIADASSTSIDTDQPESSNDVANIANSEQTSTATDAETVTELKNTTAQENPLDENVSTTDTQAPLVSTEQVTTATQQEQVSEDANAPAPAPSTGDVAIEPDSTSSIADTAPSKSVGSRKRGSKVLNDEDTSIQGSRTRKKKR